MTGAEYVLPGVEFILPIAALAVVGIIATWLRVREAEEDCGCGEQPSTEDLIDMAMIRITHRRQLLENGINWIGDSR